MADVRGTFMALWEHHVMDPLAEQADRLKAVEEQLAPRVRWVERNGWMFRLGDVVSARVDRPLDDPLKAIFTVTLSNGHSVVWDVGRSDAEAEIEFLKTGKERADVG